MSDVSTHLIFVVVCLGAIVFLLAMRHRLRTQYPDDHSKQMLSMLGFMRGMAIFAGVVFAIVLADFVRIVLTS